MSDERADTARLLVELLRAGGLPAVILWTGAVLGQCDPVLRLEVTTPEPVAVIASEPIPVRVVRDSE